MDFSKLYNKLGQGIRGRLLAGFAIIAIGLIFAVSIILVTVTRTQQFEKIVIETELPTYNALLEVDKHIFQLSASLRGWMLTHNERFSKERLATWASLNKLVIEIDDLAKDWDSEKMIDDWQEVSVLIPQYRAAQDKIEAMMNQSEAVETFWKSTFVLTDKILTKINGPIEEDGVRRGGMFGYQYKKVQYGTNQIINDMDQIKFTSYILLLLSVVLCSFIASYTARKIVNPLKSAIAVAQQIASGDRNVVIQHTATDETGELLAALSIMQESIKNNDETLKLSEEHTRKTFEKIVDTADVYSAHISRVAAGDLTQHLNIDNCAPEMEKLGHDLNVMTDSLAEITKKITHASTTMASSLEEVKNASNMQSVGVSEQATSINEITASLDEIDKSATQTMEKAKILGQLAEKTTEKGQLGLKAVEDSISGMKSVREKVQMIAASILALSNQTQQVGEITAVVNTLAQQSKMLALNASIEAAKAGDAGKGFAVVAHEIKNLAEQSEQSTGQVQKILEEIRHATEKSVLVTEEGTKGVDQGTHLVEQMGNIVHSLGEAIYETMIASQQIEAAVRQESLGIEQITSGMNEINKVTSSFVSTVKQTSESIGQLSIIAKNIKEYVDVYSV